MQYDYRCPKCHGYIRIGDHIILSARNKGLPGGLILLHPEPGNYSVATHSTFKYDKGDLVEFFCPICHHNLDSAKHLNLAMVVMTDDEGKDYDIYFSKVAGEHSTLKMIGEHMEVFGEHSGDYLDFFTLSQNY
jgi:hypothetical protein